MRSFVPCLLVFGAAIAGASIAACSSEPDPHYGPADGLRNAKFPDPTSTTPQPDSGAPSDSGTQGDAQQQNCAVSFANDIYPLMKSTGNWKCAASGCHTNGSQPTIDNTSAATAYGQITAYAINGKKYATPGVTDPAQSTFECNLQGTCGAEKMPRPDNTLNPVPATAAEIQKVDTWLKCGSPNN